MTNIRPSIAIAAGVLISGCSADPSDIWVATKATPVYASDSDVETATHFTVAAGDTCTPLRDVVMKVYLHTEIECEKGRGWVTDDRNFDIKTAS